jgi:hypothetical protein
MQADRDLALAARQRNIGDRFDQAQTIRALTDRAAGAREAVHRLGQPAIIAGNGQRHDMMAGSMEAVDQREVIADRGVERQDHVPDQIVRSIVLFQCARHATSSTSSICGGLASDCSTGDACTA